MNGMKKITFALVVLFMVVGSAVSTSQTTAQQPAQGQRRGGDPNRIDVLNMVRPIEIHDTVWMADLTSVEARDLIKAGKTTALVMTGGVEENGPYMVLDKHNIVSRVMGEAIARQLGK